jgi:hypothetical protein
VSGAPGWSNVNWLLSGKERGDMTIIHRTVRWRTGLSGEPTAPATNGRSRDQRATRGPCQRSVVHTGLSGAPTDPEDQRSDAPDMEGDRAPDCYSNCPVVHRSTEGRNCLSSWSPMAPSCLGAIKETPRRMEEYTKLSRNILRLPDSDSTHLIPCASDLSSI